MTIPGCKARGFTLIELVVVIVIIGILATLAIPAYRQYVVRAHRAEGQALLLQAAASQERFYLQAYTYATDDQLTLAPPNGLGQLRSSESGYYRLDVLQADQAAFVLAATAQAGQASDTACLVFAVDHRGRRYGGGGPTPSFDSADNRLEECW